MKIKTALLSFGMSGRVFHAPFIDIHPGFSFLGAWERSKKEITQHYPEAKSFSSLEELLADPTIDLVVVNTPNDTHFDYARKVLLANKHVVVEKAFTTTEAEARELKMLSEKQGKKLSVFQNRRWDSDFKTVRKVVNDGLLGKIIEATIAFDRYNPAIGPKAHKETPGPGAGILKDLGPHCIDQALVLFGMPTQVFADIRITRPSSLVDDCFDLLLYYPSMRVRVKGGYFVREPAPSYLIHGERGSFHKSRADVQETQLKSGMSPDNENYGREPVAEQGLLHTEVDGRLVLKRIQTLHGNYMDYYEAMFAALSQGAPVPVAVDDGIQVTRVIDCAVESSRQQKVIAV